MTTIKLTDRFRPKADLAMVRKLNDAAWQLEGDRLKINESVIAQVLASHLESLYPTDDTAMLIRHNCTRMLGKIYVQVRMPDSDRWDESVHVKLGRNICVPSSYVSTFCGGPRFSLDPLRGVTAETMEEIKAGKNDYVGSWDKFCHDQDRKERERVPASLEEWFFNAVATRKRYAKEYQRARDIAKGGDGKYPTWEEIAGEFPTLGGVIRERFGGDHTIESPLSAKAQK